MAMNKAQKRYNGSVLFLMVGYALILFGVVAYNNNHPLHGPLGYLAGVMPALPVIGVFFVMGRYLVEETDEYLRAQAAQQSLIATGITLSIATAWGFLENFSLVPHIYAYYAAIVWFAALGIGRCFMTLLAREESA